MGGHKAICTGLAVVIGEQFIVAEGYMLQVFFMIICVGRAIDEILWKVSSD